MIVNCTPLTLFLRLPEIGIFKSYSSGNGEGRHEQAGWLQTYLYDRLLGVTARVIRLDPLIKAKPNKASERVSDLLFTYLMILRLPSLNKYWWH